MLEVVGVPTIEDLLDRTVPASIRNDGPLALDPALTELEAVETLRAMAGRNRPLVSMIGMGYYGTVTPPVVLRNVLENPAWYTAYTPYQAEVSQGRLEALLNFQQMVMDLTGMELANASLLDEATAAAEAMAMARRVSKSKSARFFVDADCHPQTIAVVRTRAARLGIDVVVGDPYVADGSDLFGVLIQYPGSSGALRDPSAIVERVHAAKGLAIFATDLLAACLVEPPARSELTWWSAAPSDSGSPWGSADRTPRSSRPGMPTNARRGADHRRIGRRAGQHGVAHGVADPRAAYPPREGDFEHLHRPGAARGDGGDVRGVPRSGPVAHYRRTRAPADEGAGGGA